MVIANASVATRRVYMDLSGDNDAKLEALAKANGRTKKGQLEFLVNQAVAEFEANEKESNKRDSASRQKAKGRKG